jgi:hypothetical protein
MSTAPISTSRVRPFILFVLTVVFIDPVMALVTYILLCALHSGLQERFHPQVLGESASRAIMVVVLDFVFVQLGCYFLNVQGPSQSIDVIAYGGYKFVG